MRHYEGELFAANPDDPETAIVNLPEVFPNMSGSPRDLGIQTTMTVKI
jgi:hypothetical protein